MLIKTITFRAFMEAKTSMISSKYAFAVSSLSVPKAISHNLPWLIVNQWGPEVWKDQIQLLKDRSQLAVNTV